MRAEISKVFQAEESEVRMRIRNGEAGYDARTAVTFLLAGLGIGALAALLLTPRPMPGMILRRSKEARSPEEAAARN